MVKVLDICNLIESYAPLSYQESYDNAGLTLGNPEMEVTGVLISLDVTDVVIDEAVSNGCNMIVSHHPLIFKNIKKINGNTAVDECLIKAIKNDIALYASHTNMDSVKEGVSGKMADKLGLINRKILVPSFDENNNEYGLGIIGDLEVDLSEIDFLHFAKKKLKSECLQYSALTGRRVNKVAVAGGSCGEFVPNAIEAGADVFVVGEAKYHDFNIKGPDIVLVAAGHYQTEQFIKEYFFEIISKKISKFAVRISLKERNPIQYL